MLLGEPWGVRATCNGKIARTLGAGSYFYECGGTWRSRGRLCHYACIDCTIAPIYGGRMGIQGALVVERRRGHADNGLPAVEILLKRGRNVVSYYIGGHQDIEGGQALPNSYLIYKPAGDCLVLLGQGAHRRYDQGDFDARCSYSAQTNTRGPMVAHP